jgi:hypothetical protein
MAFLIWPIVNGGFESGARLKTSDSTLPEEGGADILPPAPIVSRPEKNETTSISFPYAEGLGALYQRLYMDNYWH